MVTNTTKRLYARINTLYNLTIQYLEESVNVSVRELNTIKTYAKKAIKYMDKYNIEITENLRQRTLKDMQERFELNNSKAKKDGYYVWITKKDADYFPAMLALTSLIGESVENMTMEKQLKTYLKYVCTYSDKFFQLVEDTTDKYKIS